MQDEHVKKVGGTAGAGLHSLWFETNKARYGPFGRLSGAPFEQQFPQNTSLSYFFGQVKYASDSATESATVPCTVVTELGFGYSAIRGSVAETTGSQ